MRMNIGVSPKLKPFQLNDIDSESEIDFCIHLPSFELNTTLYLLQIIISHYFSNINCEKVALN